MSSDFWTGLYFGVVAMTVINIIGAEFRSRYRIVRRRDDA